MTDINQLLRLNVELEGLLKVLVDRKSIHAKSLLADKFRQYSALIQQLLAEEEEGETPDAAQVEKVQTEARELAAQGQEIEVKDQEAEDSEVEDQDELAEEAIERGEKEKNHAQPNPNVLKAFSLNDKFYFVNELFDGNERDFTETLNVISEMESFEEAEDYVVNDLMLNPDSAEVKSFLDRLKVAFK